DQLTLQPPSAFRRCFHFKGRNLPDDSCTRAFWTLHFLLALAFIFHNRISDLESFPAFLALKFVSGHTVLLEFADSLQSRKPCRCPFGRSPMTRVYRDAKMRDSTWNFATAKIADARTCFP